MKVNASCKRKLGRTVLILVACCGLTVGAVPTCDQEVNDILMDGLNAAALSAAEGAINAAFEAIGPKDTTPATSGSGSTSGGSPSAPTI